jgi:hypothetical protein
MRTMTEIHERYVNWLVFCAFLLAVRSLLGGAAFVFEDSAAMLHTGAWVVGWLLGLTFLMTVNALLFRQTRLLMNLTGPADLRRRGRVSDDGFTSQAIRTAALLSCVCTVLTLGILDLAVRNLSLPAEFYVKLVLFVSLGTLSVVYAMLHVGDLAWWTTSRESA